MNKVKLYNISSNGVTNLCPVYPSLRYNATKTNPVAQCVGNKNIYGGIYCKIERSRVYDDEKITGTYLKLKHTRLLNLKKYKFKKKCTKILTFIA